MNSAVQHSVQTWRTWQTLFLDAERTCGITTRGTTGDMNSVQQVPWGGDRAGLEPPVRDCSTADMHHTTLRKRHCDTRWRVFPLQLVSLGVSLGNPMRNAMPEGSAMQRHARRPMSGSSVAECPILAQMQPPACCAVRSIESRNKGGGGGVLLQRVH